MNVRRWVVAGALFGVLWVFVRGASLTPASVLSNFLVGTAVGLVVAFVFRRLYEERLDVGRTLSAVPYATLYVAVFLKEVLVANVDVSYRVLVPGLALEPQVILVPLRVETDFGVTTIANSISLTPGTLTLDHDPDVNALYVHGIDGRDPEAIVEPIRRWEDYALVIFDEERSPADPPPEITVHPPDGPPDPKTASPDAPGSDEKRDDPARPGSDEKRDDRAQPGSDEEVEDRDR